MLNKFPLIIIDESTDARISEGKLISAYFVFRK